MDERCTKHAFEYAEDICRNCGWEFCSECLVYAFGPNEPPLCLNCALAKAGVRSNAQMPPARSKRELRKREREFRKRKKSEKALSKVEVRPQLDLSIPENSSPAFDWVNELGDGDGGENRSVVSF